MNIFSDFSIKSKLIIAIIFLLTTALGMYTTFILYANYKKDLSDLIKNSKLQTHLIADYVITPLLFADTDGAADVLAKLSSIPNINAAVLYDENGKQFASYRNQTTKKVFANVISSFVASDKHVHKEVLISTPITHKDKNYGVILFYVSTLEIDQNFFETATILFLSMIIVILLSLLIIYRIQRYITLPIINLAQITKEISISDDYTIRAQKMFSDEVGNLYDDFNYMLDKIEQRGRERDEAETISQTYQAHLERLTNELEERVSDRTLELQESLENLQDTQSQLIESEKMSSLGNLVAGVAHEVNTPLGISITAASIFDNEIKTIKGLLKENKLSKSALDHFLETISEADDILIKNLNRAALLVKNFKKISVDQSSEEIRDFELNKYLKEVVSTFKNELKHRPVTLEVKLQDKDILMHSFPGAISQLIVNLLQNTLLHAFEYEQKGHIILETYHKDDKAIIHFKDDGKGVDDTVVDKIFEPFVTTKRNKGGTGLGLNITYNLVTQHLKGNIRLDKEHTPGACFIIEIPCHI